MPKTLDPRVGNIHIDANAFDAAGTARNSEFERLRQLAEAGEISVMVSYSVATEISHPRTPRWVQKVTCDQIQTLKVPLTSTEVETVNRISRLMTGNAQQGKHEADATHLFEASKYGRYFITHDKRILYRRSEIQSLLGSIRIVTLSEFLADFDRAVLLQAK